MVKHETQISPDDRFVRMSELQKIVSLSRSQIYALISKGAFPKQVKLGEKASAWLLSRVLRWMQARINQSGTSNSDALHQDNL